MPVTRREIKEMFGGASTPRLLFSLKDLMKDNRYSPELLPKRTSISGYQPKFCLVLHGRELRLTTQGGDYIMKPPPFGLDLAEDAPANEYLTMSLARKLFGFNTAVCTLLPLADGQNVYISRRFDRDRQISLLREDFAGIAGVKDKYDYSYEELGELILKYLPAGQTLLIDYLKIIMFNWLIANGDAHLKNFSKIVNPEGFILPAPYYDLMNTRLHGNDPGLALQLFRERNVSQFSIHNMFLLAEKLKVKHVHIERFIFDIVSKSDRAQDMINESSLSENGKREYLGIFRTRMKYFL